MNAPRRAPRYAVNATSLPHNTVRQDIDDIAATGGAGIGLWERKLPEGADADVAARMKEAAVRQILKAWSSGGVAGADAVMLDVALPLHATADAARGRAARAAALARGEEPKPVIFQGE